MARVLGIDPGLGRTGVAVVEGTPGSLRLLHEGCLLTDDGQTDSQRLLHLYRALALVVATHRPDVAAVERLFFSTNRATAMRVSEARGVLLCALAAAGVAVAEYTPNEVKETVAGYGAAHKAQVMRMSARLLGVSRIAGPDDIADACAVAICHHHRARLVARTALGHTGAGTLDAAVTAARARLASAR